MELQFVQAYEVLGVKPWAPEAEVREAHAELEAAWNAAPSTDPTAEQERATVNAAFEAIRGAGFPKDPAAQAAPPAPRPMPQYTPDFSSSVYQTQRSGVNSGRLIMGIILIVVGIIITSVSYDAAASSPNGGNYIIAFGPIVAGVIQVFKALVSN